MQPAGQSVALGTAGQWEIIPTDYSCSNVDVRDRVSAASSFFYQITVISTHKSPLVQARNVYLGAPASCASRVPTLGSKDAKSARQSWRIVKL